MSSSPTPDQRTRRVAEEAVEHALLRLLRGGTWQSLTSEVAWKAVRATGAASEVVPALAELVDARLASEVDTLAPAVEQASVDAAAAHLREWPHDHVGADTAAVLDGRAEAERLLAERYLGLLEWTAELLGGAVDREKLELPSAVARQLQASRRRFGWPRRSAA